MPASRLVCFLGLLTCKSLRCPEDISLTNLGPASEPLCFEFVPSFEILAPEEYPEMSIFAEKLNLDTMPNVVYA